MNNREIDSLSIVSETMGDIYDIILELVLDGLDFSEFNGELNSKDITDYLIHVLSKRDFSDKFDPEEVATIYIRNSFWYNPVLEADMGKDSKIISLTKEDTYRLADYISGYFPSDAEDFCYEYGVSVECFREMTWCD